MSLLADTVFLPGSGCKSHPGFCGCLTKSPPPASFFSICFLIAFLPSKCFVSVLFKSEYCLVSFFSGPSYWSTGFYFASFHYIVRCAARVCPFFVFLFFSKCTLVSQLWLHAISHTVVSLPKWMFCSLVPSALDMALSGPPCTCQIFTLSLPNYPASPYFFGFIFRCCHFE